MNERQEVVFAGAVRTAIGKFGGSLAEVPPAVLGESVARASLTQTDLAPADIEEVVMGQVLQAGSGLNVARQVALRAGMPEHTPAYSVNKVCASGMKALELAAMAIRCGDRRIMLAGGVENMSAAPFLLKRARWGYRLGDGELLDSLHSEALTDPLAGGHMGVTAEHLADEFAISRQDQDAFAATSQARAADAMTADRFKPEIVPVEVAQKKGPPVVFDTDEFPRPGTTVAALAGLKPAFRPEGTVTAGNAAGINDGAAAMVVMAADEARQRGVRPLGRLLACATVGVEPSRMGFGPAPATRAVLAKAGLALDAIDLFELNEAFAAQALAVIRDLGVDPDKVNVNGGAIALGHPVGASGARIVVTLLHALRLRRLRYGLAALCVGGGQGMAMIVERIA